MALPRSSRLLRRGLNLLEASERTWLQSSHRRTALVASYPLAARALSTSPSLYRKNKPEKQSSQAASSSSAATSPDGADPRDVSPLTAAFASIDTHHREQLQTLLRGGRFNPNALGALPVTVKTEAGAVETHPLRELAQVVPRAGGRTVSLLLNDRAYIKPVMAAVQASPDYNQQPQRADDNELELLLRIEAERADDLIRLVRAAAQAWREQVRQARRKHDKVFKDAKKGGWLPDVVRAAEKEVQKVQDQKMKEIDEEEKKAIRQIGQRKA